MAIIRPPHPGKVSVRVSHLPGWGQTTPLVLFSRELTEHLVKKAVAERARAGYDKTVIVDATAEGSTSTQRVILDPGSAIPIFYNDDERYRPSPDDLP